MPDSGDGAGGVPTSSSTEKGDAAHVNKVVDSQQSATDSNNNSSVGSVDKEGDVKTKAADSIPSTSL